jgi:hypothetical protein
MSREDLTLVGSEGVELPFARNAFQGVLASVIELDARACDEILHRSRNEDFARLRKSGKSRSDVDGEARQLLTVAFALACMQTRSNLKTLVASDLDDPPRARDRACRSIKRCEEAIADSVDLLPAVEGEFASYSTPVRREHPPPPAITDLGSSLG